MDESTRAFLALVMQDRVGGRYVVERLLGVGGMGLVAAAQYPELGQDVAIKFMRQELAADVTLSARFLREARLAARAKSPHFVRVFDFGRLPSGVPYLVMEMLTGRDLGEELRQRGPLPVEEAVDYVLQASLGLAEIHGFGIVHRDLKPGNLFIAEAAGTRTLKVLDLGLSTEGTGGVRGLTTTGHTFGTPHYMSPEQIRESKGVDARSDIWALGVILFELLTGALPFGQGSESAGEVFGLILHTAPASPRRQRPDLPEGLEAVILRCLHRTPEERYASLADLGDALRPFAGAGSAGRADAIRAALAQGAEKAAAQPLSPPGLDLPRPFSPPPAPQVSAPSVTAPTRPLGPAVRTARVDSVAGGAYAMQASSGPPSYVVPTVRRGWFVLVGVGALLVGAATTIVLVHGSRSGDAGASTEPTTSAPTTPPAPAEATQATALTRLEPPPVSPTAPEAGAAPTVAKTLPPGPSPAPMHAGGVNTGHGPSPRAAPPVPPPTSTPASTSVLDGLDRK